MSKGSGHSLFLHCLLWAWRHLGIIRIVIVPTCSDRVLSTKSVVYEGGNDEDELTEDFYCYLVQLISNPVK